MSQKKKKSKSRKKQNTTLKPIANFKDFEILEDDFNYGWQRSIEHRKTKLSAIGVKLIEARDADADDEAHYRCDWYVFTKMLGLTWFDAYRQSLFSENNDSSQPIYSKTVSFLGKRGFARVSQPRAGDVVAYVTRDKNEIELYGKQRNAIVTHFGIYRGDNMVESKWGTGSVYLHPINYVLDTYGTEVIFFRAS